MNQFVSDPATDYAGLRVVHAANYQVAKDGAEFFNCDLKFHQGLVQTGCFVYPFSINDRARMLSPIRSKTFGMRAANRSLVETCRNVQPDLLVLGHAQHVDCRTLEQIRSGVPGVKICLWYIDPVWPGSPIRHLRDRLDLLDAVFVTTGGTALMSLSRPHCPAAFIPNPVERSIERGRVFELERAEYDLVFFGRDKQEPARREFLSRLVRQCGDLRIGVFGSLGHPPAFGSEKDRILRVSRAALNLSRRNDVELYSSDRISQIVGNGVLAVTAAGCGLQHLFADDEVLYFRDAEHAADEVRQLAGDDERARWMASRGWERAHSEYSAAKVARFMLDLTFRREGWRCVRWADFVYGGSLPGRRVPRPPSTGDAA